MKMSEALDIVYQLAEQNVLEIGPSDSQGLQAEADKQNEALNMVHDLIVNQFEEDGELDDFHSMYCTMVNFLENTERYAVDCMDKLRAMRERSEVRDNG